MIKKHWPLWVKLLLSPFVLAGIIISLPVIVLLMIADPDKAEAIMVFWAGD